MRHQLVLGAWVDQRYSLRGQRVARCHLIPEAALVGAGGHLFGHVLKHWRGFRPHDGAELAQHLGRLAAEGPIQVVDQAVELDALVAEALGAHRHDDVGQAERCVAGQQHHVRGFFVQSAGHVAHVVAGQVGPLHTCRVVDVVTLQLFAGHRIPAVTPICEGLGRGICLLVLLAHTLLGATQHGLAEVDSAFGGSYHALAGEVAGHTS